MNSVQFQKILKRSVVGQMRADLRSGESLKGYFSDSYPLKEKDVIYSTIAVQGKFPQLKIPKEDVVSADLENALMLYAYYPKLDETQASDPRLWLYLSHVEFRRYTLARWGLKKNYKDLVADPTQLKSAISQILEHWFGTGGDLKGLRRHSIARLWWAAHLTYAPWERDPDFFSDLKNKDPYHYTRILLSTQDIYQQVLERAMGRSNRILISVLDYLGNNKEFAQSRDNIRNLMKELNLAYGSRKLIVLDRPVLKALIERLAEEINQGT